MYLSRRGLVLIIAAGCLQAGDLDVYLQGNFLFPSSVSRNGTLDPATGSRLGSSVGWSGELRQFGAGVQYSFISLGNWRLRAGLEAATGSSTPLSLNYLRFQGLAQNSAVLNGSVIARSVTPLVSLVFVSSGAGEYGLSYEQHFDQFRYALSNGVVVRSDAGSSLPRSLTWHASDPFLAVHATFLQRYLTFGCFARVGFGVALASPRSLADLTEADFLGASPALLELARPRQELALALGTRF